MKRLLVIAVFAGALAACGSSSHGGTTTTAPASFPATVTAANGAVTISSRPARILSLSATATEMVYAIGAGSQVIGVDKYSTDPPNAPKTNFDGTESAESYVPVHPDLVLLAFDTGGKLVSQLSTLHIPVLLLPPAKTLDDTYAQFDELGAATGHRQEATAEIAKVRQQLDTIVQSVGTRAKGLTYYHEVDNTLYTATSKTFIGALYARLGMVNVADAADKTGSGYPQLSAEFLIKADPDFIFLSDSTCCQQSAATVAKRPGYQVMKAVRLGHVIVLPDPVASQWGPRVVDFLQDVANAVEQTGSTTSTT